MLGAGYSYADLRNKQVPKTGFELERSLSALGGGGGKVGGQAAGGEKTAQRKLVSWVLGLPRAQLPKLLGSILTADVLVSD